MAMQTKTHWLAERKYYSAQPWKYIVEGDVVEIMAYAEASGNWETVATINHTTGHRSAEVAAYMVRAVNLVNANSSIFAEIEAILSQVLADGLDFSAEQAAEKILRSIRNV